MSVSTSRPAVPDCCDTGYRVTHEGGGWALYASARAPGRGDDPPRVRPDVYLTVVRRPGTVYCRCRRPCSGRDPCRSPGHQVVGEAGSIVLVLSYTRRSGRGQASHVRTIICSRYCFFPGRLICRLNGLSRGRHSSRSVLQMG
jgi:hypothetical protein